MSEDIRDITEFERMFLAAIKKRPRLYFGKTSLTAFYYWFLGYRDAMMVTQNRSEHRILPDEFYDYAAMKYLGRTETPLNWYYLILQHEPDEEKAFYIFFEMLDEYLVGLGYEPIPEWEDIKDKWQKRGNNNA